MEGKLLVSVIAVIALLIGGVLGAQFFAVSTEVVKEVPVEVIKNVEVIKEIPVEVIVSEKSLLLADAEQAMLEELEDEELLGDFDLDQVSISKVRVFKVDYSDSDEVVVELAMKLKLMDEDFDEKEFMEVNGTVIFEDGEEAVVELN
jgi:hypothetical protein